LLSLGGTVGQGDGSPQAFGFGGGKIRENVLSKKLVSLRLRVGIWVWQGRGRPTRDKRRDKKWEAGCRVLLCNEYFSGDVGDYETSRKSFWLFLGRGKSRESETWTTRKY
jgi:hypothetical protein